MVLAMDDTRKECNGLFTMKRISSTPGAIVLLLYFPFGVVLTVLRICLTLNYICACAMFRLLFSDESQFLRLVHYLFLFLLGIKVTFSGKIMPSRGVVLNRKTFIDGLILNRILNTYGPNLYNLPTFFLPLFRLKSSKDLTKPDKLRVLVTIPPGHEASRMPGLELEKTCIISATRVQLGAISTVRFLPILPSTEDSKWWQDLLWMYFCPMTLYKVTLASISLKRSETESESNFMARLGAEMFCYRQSLWPEKYPSKTTTPKKAECVKEFVQKRHRIPTPQVQEMVESVLEVAPHVPKDVIIGDLEKTGSVDVTLTNIFEGVVKFIPIDASTQHKKPSTLKKQNYNNLSMGERKTLFYQQARRRFVEKHGV